MKTVLFSVSLITVLCVATASQAQRQGRFGNADNLSYVKIKSLYGKVPTDKIESQLLNDTANYFLYVWISDSVQEIGVRMFSPVPASVFPNKGEQMTEDYSDTMRTKSFSPLLILEYSQNASTAMDAFDKNHVLVWRQLSPASHADGASALLRIHADAKKKVSLKGGLYRIRFSAVNEKNPEGCFLVQLGLSERVNDFRLYRMREELH